MCGRLNVVADPLSMLVSEMLGINFSTVTNNNLSPSQQVATIYKQPNNYQQIDANWGIQPSWSKRLLINAQSETVATKPTFKSAFAQDRCLVPCSGWFEWRTEEGKKVKYSFCHENNEPLFMAGILYNPDAPQLVTLTTSPNQQCGQYHKRMPVLISPNNFDYWFNAKSDELAPLMEANENEFFQIQKSA